LNLSSPNVRAYGRAAARTAVGVIALLVVYVAAANVLLSGGRLPRLLSRNPETFRVTYTSARSWWPQRVHVEGLDVRVRDATMELELHIDHADVNLSLWALVVRRLHTSRVEARGVTWRMRFRGEEGALSPDRIARLPPIDGFPPVPLLDVPPLPASDASAHPFDVDLEGLDVRGVREVWIEDFRLTGDLNARGGFLIAARDHFEVRPAHVDVHDATLSTGDDVMVAAVHGVVDARVDRTPIDDATKGIEVLRNLSSRSVLEGDVGGLVFVRHFVPESIAPAGGAGTFRGTLVIERGVVTAESASHMELGPASVAFGGANQVAVGATTIDVTTSAEDSGVAASSTVVLRDVRLTAPGAQPPIATSQVVTLHVGVDETDLAVLPRDFHYAWDAPATSIRDLGGLEPLLGPERGFRLEGGSAKAATSGHGSLHELEARARVDSSAAMSIDEAHVTAQVSADVAARVKLDERIVDFAGSAVELAELRVRGGTPHPGWVGHVKLLVATIHVTPPALDLTFHSTASDARPMLALYSAMKGVSVAARMALAIVPDPAIETATANLVADGRLHVAPETVALHGLDVRGEATRARGEWTKRGKTASGGFLFEAGPVSVGLAFDETGARPILAGAQAWFASITAKGTP
jgi:hypothetical protein